MPDSTRIGTENQLSHLAIIMDGNGRWAKKRGKMRTAGHEAGAQNVREITTWCAQNGIKFLTLYAFSTENWNRPKSEVDTLMSLLEKYLKQEAKTYHKHRIRFRAIGDIDFFYQPLKDLILDLQAQTANYENFTQTLALNYGSRNEISRTFLKLTKTQNLENLKSLSSSEIELLIRENLDTFDMPEVDLLVRTGGEQRLSNFLLWQVSYAELYFSDTLWPDFSTQELEKIIKDFSLRKRRFGGVE